MNLKSKTLTEYPWYIVLFMTKVHQLKDSRSEFWKEKFISGLPALFAEKLRLSLRNNNSGINPYHNRHYCDIIQTINQVGLDICNDKKLRGQLKNPNLLERKVLSKFCYQFGINSSLPKKSKYERNSKYFNYKKTYKKQ